MDFTKYVNSWISYHNDEYGFSFDYPAVFADPAWRSCNVSAKPGVSIGSTLVTVGWQGTLVISHADGVTADEFIDGRLKANASDNNFRSGPKVKQIVAGVSAVNIEYQFGGLGRYGTATALVHNGHLFLFNYEAGADCSIPEANMDGFMAYLHMIETFKFDK